MPCSTPGTPRPMADPPAASTPTSRTGTVDEAGKRAGSIGTAPDTRHHQVGVAPPEQDPALLTGLLADDPLELTHHPRKRDAVPSPNPRQ